MVLWSFLYNQYLQETDKMSQYLAFYKDTKKHKYKFKEITKENEQYQEFN